MDDGDDDDNTIWEVFYKIPVTDNITVTPAIFGIADLMGRTDERLRRSCEDHLQVLIPRLSPRALFSFRSLQPSTSVGGFFFE